jgi:hypothetical protein
MRLRDRFPCQESSSAPLENEPAREEEEQQLRVNSITAWLCLYYKGKEDAVSNGGALIAWK